MGGTSRVSREAQARICERLGVRFPGATRRSAGDRAPMPIKAPYALPDEQTKSALEIDEFQGRRRI
jgi:hypothetical protein